MADAAPMQVDAPIRHDDVPLFPGAQTQAQPGVRKQQLRTISSSLHEVTQPNLDLDTYISNYTGHTKIVRLLFIARHCPSLRLEAYKMAIAEVQKTSNTTLYLEISQKLQELLHQSGDGETFTADQAWIDSVDKRATQLQEKLDLDIKGYRNKTIKEGIRVGQNDLGDFFYDRGELENALRCYSRARDYCTTAKHIVAMCLNVIKVSVELENWGFVNAYVTKAEMTPDVSEDPTIVARLKCCLGLHTLQEGKYKNAARHFLETTFDLGSTFSDVIAPQDVAVYGGLCALASYDRGELKRKVIDSQPFKQFLELVPEVREIIHDFYASRYASMLKHMATLKEDLLLDIHLHDHVTALYKDIRNKALVQYCSPFLTVDLRSMADAFGTSVAGLEKELSVLIMDSLIPARIDSHNKILHARQVDQRSTLYQRALATGEQYEQNARAMLLRMSVNQHNFQVRAPPKDTDRHERRLGGGSHPERKELHGHQFDVHGGNSTPPTNLD
eukprot:Opistho-2@42535